MRVQGWGVPPLRKRVLKWSQMCQAQNMGPGSFGRVHMGQGLSREVHPLGRAIHAPPSFVPQHWGVYRNATNQAGICAHLMDECKQEHISYHTLVSGCCSSLFRVQFHLSAIVARTCVDSDVVVWQGISFESI